MKVLGSFMSPKKDTLILKKKLYTGLQNDEGIIFTRNLTIAHQVSISKNR